MSRTAALMVLALAAAGVTTSTASAAEPPMGNFNSAFYTCDNGAAFSVNYDGRRPKTAELITSNNNKHYALKRTSTKDAPTFAADAVNFVVRGDAAEVSGTEVALQNCKRAS